MGGGEVDSGEVIVIVKSRVAEALQRHGKKLEILPLKVQQFVPNLCRSARSKQTFSFTPSSPFSRSFFSHRLSMVGIMNDETVLFLYHYFFFPVCCSGSVSITLHPWSAAFDRFAAIS